MVLLRNLMVAALCLLVCAATDASKDASPSPIEPTEYKTVVRQKRKNDGLDAQRRLDQNTAGFATAIELDHETGARSADALPEILSRTPASNVRSVGGLGQYSSLSLRGGGAQQVAFFLDGVPLGGADAGLLDLGELPLDTLEHVEIYRGFIPIAFGGAALGGAINLVSKIHRGSTRLRLRTASGSFGSRELLLGYAQPVRANSSVAVDAGYATTTGNFPYLDTQKTRYDRSDDRIRERINNGYERMLGQIRYDAKRGHWRYGITQRGFYKTQGLPGSAGAPTAFSDLRTLTSRTVVHAKHNGFSGPGGWASGVLGISFDQRRLTIGDRSDGYGIGTETTSTRDVYASPRMRIPLWHAAFLRWVGDIRHEAIGIHNNAVVSGPAPSGKATRSRLSYGTGAQLEMFIWQRKLQIAPAVRIDILQNRFATASGAGEVEDLGRDRQHLGVSPRLGMRLRVHSNLEIRGSVGRYFRAPTLVELFGNRGYIVGHEGLKPESGTAADIGLVFDRSKRRLWPAYIQLAAFATWSRDLIQWFPSGTVVQPRNQASARVVGLELGWSTSAWRRRLRWLGAYTLLHTQPTLGGRPRHRLFSRLSLGDQPTAKGRIFYSFDLSGGTYLDNNRRMYMPVRTLHGAGIEMEPVQNVRFAIEARNLLNTRQTLWRPPVGDPIVVPLSDFIGYPLPGRSFWLTLSITFESNAAKLPHNASIHSGDPHVASKQF